MEVYYENMFTTDFSILYSKEAIFPCEKLIIVRDWLQPHYNMKNRIILFNPWDSQFNIFRAISEYLMCISLTVSYTHLTLPTIYSV